MGLGPVAKKAKTVAMCTQSQVEDGHVSDHVADNEDIPDSVSPDYVDNVVQDKDYVLEKRLQGQGQGGGLLRLFCGL